jgi:cellulose synthase/poly-beta-1,6-N-acetylglucosamine synthase-like glycosyltransferase
LPFNIYGTVVLIVVVVTGFFTIYNGAILAWGLSGYLRKSKKEPEKDRKNPKVLPFISIILPVKNEEPVIERSLQTLSQLQYPKEKYEVLVVEDGSTDRTPEICREFARTNPETIKLVTKVESDGKPSALNFGLKYARGSIIGVFDADNLPIPDALMKVAEHFAEGAQVVQGSISVVNENGSGFLARLQSYERKAYNNVFYTGKDRLGLFVPLLGSCQFISRHLLEDLNGWDPNSLTEDAEISIRIAKRQVPISYQPEVISKEEAPSTIKAFFRQRLRWFRGWIELILPTLSKVSKGGLRMADALVTIMGSMMAPFFIMLPILVLLSSIFPQLVLFGVTNVILEILTLFLIFTAGPTWIALSVKTKIKWDKAILWAPIIVLYFILLNFIASIALFQVVTKSPKRWERTPKTGEITMEEGDIWAVAALKGKRKFD